MSAVDVKFTYQDLRSTPDDGNRYELFEGDLIVSPAPTFVHQRIVSRLLRLVSNYIAEHHLGEVVTAPCDVIFSDDTVVEPDLLFISNERSSIIREEGVAGAPDLVVEVVSKSSGERDRGFKLKLYAQEGVREYWVIDPLNKSFEVYSLGLEGFGLVGKFQEQDEARGVLFPELKCRVSELWS